MLKGHGVEYFKNNELELKISPIKYLNASQNESVKGKSDKVTDDDLYYSATTLKPKVK